jgi:hypothetical protein
MVQEAERLMEKYVNRTHVFEGIAWLDGKCVDAIGYKCFREVVPSFNEL